ncbi:hypothetical protein [Methylibium sp.]|uniref:hypothetical protein n=1 Tax=Methylibium sp. TaxID=2067992 RepID=UPI003D0A2EA4
MSTRAVAGQEDGYAGRAIKYSAKHMDLQSLINRLFFTCLLASFEKLKFNANFAQARPQVLQLRRLGADTNPGNNLPPGARQFVQMIELDS